MSQQNSSYDLNFHKILGGGATPDPGPTPWVRPSEWPNIDSLIGPSDDKIAMVAAVYDDGDATTNFVQIQVTAVGGFTVDWGDGTVTNYASATNATHLYDYTDVSLTSTSYGYKCAVIVVTAQTPPNLITAVTFNTTLPTGIRSIPILDIDARLPGCTSFASVGNTGTLQNSIVQFRLRSSAISSFGNFFNNCGALQSVLELTSTVPATYITAIRSCYSLEYVSGLNLSTATSVQSLFQDCLNLKSVSSLTANNATNASNMFSNCRKLITISDINMSSVTTLTTMFATCTSLRSVSNLNLSAATSLASLFLDLTSLYSVSNITASSCTNFSSFFSGCFSLVEVSGLITSAGTNFSSFFANCRGLKSAPLIDTSLGTNFTSFFSNCSSLVSVPLLNTANGITFTTMFNGCTVLAVIPSFNMSSGTTCSSMFTSCLSLIEIPAINFAAATTWSSNLVTSLVRCNAIFKNNATVSLTSTKMSAAALDVVYTNLPTASGSPSINITGAPGVSGDDPSIATAKGWTVTGS